jgi:hypothetical protein
MNDSANTKESCGFEPCIKRMLGVMNGRSCCGAERTKYLFENEDTKSNPKEKRYDDPDQSDP